MKIVLTGGGTAGHAIPNIALLPYLKTYFSEISYIGSENGIERELANKNKVTFYSIPTTKLKRSLSLSNLLIPFKLICGINHARKLLKQLVPDVVFSKGGYVSVPVVIAAHQLKIPVVSHESDLTMGLANKLTSKYCQSVCTSFSLTAQNLKNGVCTGSPIRNELLNGNKETVFKKHNLNRNKPTILVMGGSLGANAINTAIFSLAPTLCEKFNIIHIVGKGNVNNNISQKNYVQIEFTNNIQDYFSACDYVISRAGSNAIFEFLALKKPMILIPLPKDQSRGDQIQNAEYFESHGYALTFNQEKLSDTQALLNSIDKLILKQDYYINNMKKLKANNGTKNLFEQIKKVCENFKSKNSKNSWNLSNKKHT